MKTKRKSLIIFLSLILLVASAGLTAALIIPTAEDLLNQSVTTLETITEGHAVVEATVELPDQTMTGTVEVWGKLNVGPNGEPAIRLEVLAASEPELVGITAVSDGTQFWLYDPGRNAVVTGTAAEMGPILAEKMAEMENYEGHEGEFDHFGEGAFPLEGEWGDFDPESMDVPETPEEAIAMLLEYFTTERNGGEMIGSNEAYRLRLIPIPEQMPDEVRAAGGFVNLWLRQSDQLPLAIEYAEGALGYAKIVATTAEINTGLADSLFTFDIPEGAELIQAMELMEQMEALYEAGLLEQPGHTADFTPLTATDLPADATLADTQEMGGSSVQRYTRPDDLSFVIAQGATLPLEKPAEATRTESVTVRGIEGTLFTNESESRTLLAWQEADSFVLIGGDLTPDEALAIAESMQ